MKDNQHEQLCTELTYEFETSTFTELDDEIAANCSGGVVHLYQDDNFQGRRLQFFNEENDLRKWNFNDKTSSLTIQGDELWTFYRDINFGGPSVTLGSGTYTLSDLKQEGIPNDSISSLRRLV
jgi:hypothetical protein